jgi:hypothetical protein
MTIQRTTHLLSAPISACLRAFVRAAQPGMKSITRPFAPQYSCIGNLGMNMFERSIGGGAGISYGNSAPLKGSA